MEGFKIGADDYITKPFDSEVLLCKINAILKRQGLDTTKNSMTIVDIGTLSFNYEMRTLTSPEKKIKLSPKESELLRMLYLNKNNSLVLN